MMTISGPLFTWLLCGLVAVGVVIAIGVLIFRKVKPIKKKTMTIAFAIAALCILIGILLLWLV